MHFFFENEHVNKTKAPKTDNIVQQFLKKETMSKRQNQPNLHCVQRERYFKCKTVQNFSWMCVCVRVWVDFGTEHISSGWHTERSVESEILKTIAKKMEAVHKWYPFPRAHLHTDNVPSCIKDIVVHFIVTGKMVFFFRVNIFFQHFGLSQWWKSFSLLALFTVLSLRYFVTPFAYYRVELRELLSIEMGPYYRRILFWIYRHTRRHNTYTFLLLFPWELSGKY